MNFQFLKHSLWVFGGLLILVSVTHAQDYDKKIHFGFKGGVNFSDFSKDVGPFDKKAPGYDDGVFAKSSDNGGVEVHLGVTADYALNDVLSVSTELLFNGFGKGYTMKRDDIIIVDTAGKKSAGYDNYNYTIYYLELPLILRYQLPINSRKVLYNVYGGLSPAMKVFSNTTYNYYAVNPYGDVDQAEESKPIPNLRNFLLNGVFGFYVTEKDPSPTEQFTTFVDFRFEYSLSPVFNKTQYQGANYQTNIWTVNLGFGIRF